MSFARLEEKIKAKRTPLALHLAPEEALLPPAMVNNFRSLFGDVPQTTTEALRMYCCGALEAAEELPAVVIDAGCFLRFGALGAEVLSHIIGVAKNKGFYTILDVNCDRPDVWFAGFSPDAVTVSPYGGSDAMRSPAEDADLFVLLRSANPSAGEVQSLMAGDRKLSAAVGELILRAGRGGAAVGAVVGGDNPLDVRDLRRRMEHVFFLLPQCSAETGSYAFGERGEGALLLCPLPPRGDVPYQEAIRSAVAAEKAALKKFVTVI